MNTKLINEKFAEHFGASGELYASPGRINLIGEHTDYNGGFVFPGAIDKGMVAEIRLNGTDRVRAYSVDLDDYAEFGLQEQDAPSQGWARYIFGVCREIEKRGGKIAGFDTAFSGDVPLGAGMSSSAALESTFANALNEIFALGIDRFELARIGQSTEHNYCGVNCGIMDQFASVFGKAGHLMRLDCRSMEFRYFPFDPEAHGYRLVLLDSVVKHELVDSPYNKRRESCERVVAAIAKRHPEVKFLRDATMEMLDEVSGEISEEDRKRARFVIGETQRVLDVCQALEQGDYETVGERMYQTHEGLSKDYEVSCVELDHLNEIARECGVTGSRIMGGGFGGCTINLVKSELYDDFISTAKSRFAERWGHQPKVYDVVISDGARKL
ncbi:MAG: galactokinase [Alistipes sp.]|nr:galactokinase [Alistipes sp.]